MNVSPKNLKLLAIFGFISVLGTVAAPLAARAGQPDDDAQVKLMQINYRWGRAPKVEDLALGQSWTCKYRSAEPGSRMNAVFPNSYRFAVNSDGSIDTGNSGLATSYALGERSMNGFKTWGPKITGEEHIRVGIEGELLVEFALPECSWYECLYVIARAPSIENAREPLVGYSECRL